MFFMKPISFAGRQSHLLLDGLRKCLAESIQGPPCRRCRLS
ncbi:MAG: hypothetical protein [Olavius algarvensis Delta 4 endosymbiont]|nr:MAG: hypothetical protein [Olavius algarvensis Delta 4 endosymbiont]